tara:strand:+ start:334 stop:786 length:453 start_codon:yes stop_codon:yes gene_type:complete
LRLLIRRVDSANVKVAGSITGQIKKGLVVYVGIEKDDEISDLEWGVKKTLGLRIFDDSDGKMNLPINYKMGILVVSQFTLHGNLKKGYRPSFNRAAVSNLACPLYNKFIDMIGESFDGAVKNGKFGAHMKIALQEDGPVTIWLDSKNKNY